MALPYETARAALKAAPDISDEIRYLQKWLNEQQTAPIDRAALATVLLSITHPATVAPKVEPVGGFRYNDYHGWQQVSKEYENDADVTKLYTSPPAADKRESAAIDATMKDGK